MERAVGTPAQLAVGECQEQVRHYAVNPKQQEERKGCADHGFAPCHLGFGGATASVFQHSHDAEAADDPRDRERRIEVGGIHLARDAQPHRQKPEDEHRSASERTVELLDAYVNLS